MYNYEKYTDRLQYICNNAYIIYLTAQGHPMSIFGKYLFGRRFEILNSRNIFLYNFLPACLSKDFRTSKNGIIAHF